MWATLKLKLEDIKSHTSDPEYNKFRIGYFYNFTVAIGFIIALSSPLWIIKDSKFIEDSIFIYSLIFRLIPILVLPFYFIIKNKQKAWRITFISIWLSIICTVIYCSTVPESSLTGDGWISYYILFFALSMTIPRQYLLVISNIVFTILVILTSDQYLGTIHYINDIWKPVSTGLIISFGLFIAALIFGGAIARLYDAEKALENLAKVDMLSGLYNRHKLDDLTENGNLKKPSTIMIIDVDKFKSINDTYGHLCGDEAIIYTSRILRSVCRKEDILLRYGGDEFIIVFDDFVNPYTIFKRLKNALRKNNTYNITFSIGAYNCSQKDLNLDSSIKKADSALYKSKEQGRDQINIYRDEV